MSFNAVLPVKMVGGPTTALVVKYRDAPAYSITARAWLESNTATCPIAPYFARRWDERTEPFWWSAITLKNVRSARTIRTHMNRKIRHAFTESLKKKGYRPDGSRLPGEEDKPPLTGSAHIAPTEEVLRTKMKDLILQTDIAVESILQSQMSGQAGRRRPKQDILEMQQEHTVKEVKDVGTGPRITKYTW